MKKYKVKVNGKVYEVELETVEEVKGSIQTNIPSEEKKVSVSEGDKEFVAPIAGKILDIKVSVNQTIKKGDVLCIIEAMKLENEVIATYDGVVKEIKISKGAMVANKDVLMIIG